ncbi:flagellar motor switch protein FliG [Georgenia satyanarayanai]|uniref:Flagellar motor switch protein FliG n=1 Tax=Georgenia satyanarayanai TaxID=860221 RepID=A0A2Y9BWM3_9MICO|nr:flagellar motor switch protein FliG [Georgenia satyanarayanai]PYG01073.1 flagellar motor switch protein FliG [Georgenia satyanarayanai]SSA39312.1 flagellar motor switch protein FliG [Georgenia satyanarayanai]
MNLTSPQKAAVVLLQLGHERATKVLALLEEQEVEEISAEIARMETVPSAIADQVLVEFYDQANGGAPVAGHGGLEYAQRLLEDSLGAERASLVMGRLTTLLAGQPFDFLQQAEPRQVLSLINGEHPQTMAVVLAHLRPERASAIMAGLPPAERADVAMRIGTMEQASPDAVMTIADSLQRRAGHVLTAGEPTTAVGGIQPLVEILNRADPSTEKQILEELGQRDEALAEQVRSLMFTFEDVIHLDDRAVQLVLRQTDTSGLALALKGTSAELTEKIKRNLSERARLDLVDEMEIAGAVRVSEVHDARGAIVKVIRTLEESGQIVVRRDAEDEYVS